MSRDDEERPPMANGEADQGGGSGGGPEAGDQHVSAQTMYLITGNQVGLFANAAPTDVPPLPVITLLSAGETGLGSVDIRGALGVRVTTGPIGEPALHNVAQLPGVEVEVPVTSCVSLKQGPAPPGGSSIEMRPVAGITINAGAMPVTVLSTTRISLTVGASSIEVTGAGVSITAPTLRVAAPTRITFATSMFNVNATATIALKAPLTTVDP